MDRSSPEITEQFKRSSHPTLEQPSQRSRLVRKFLLVGFFFIVILFAYFGFRILTAPEGPTNGELSLFTQIKHLITSSDKEVKGENEDRINILVMGVGGKSHEGPYLTDTMILLSLQPSTQKIGIISIPRDLLVTIPGIGEGKINSAYVLTEIANPNQGGPVVGQIIESIFGTPVQYYAVIDFDGFEKIIDELGGITVNVENTLNDPYYPIPGKEEAPLDLRYEHLYIEKGIRFMNGETALRFVRSRKASGIEGSDFARSRRQQKVILAVKEKLLAPTTLLNFNKINRLYQSISENTDTNMEIWELLKLYDLTKGVSSSNITNVILDDSPTGLLKDEIINEGFYLVPSAGDWSELQSLARDIFHLTATSTATTVFTPTPVPDKQTDQLAKNSEKQKKLFTLEIDNGTKTAGLAKRSADYLEGHGYQVSSIGNAPIQTYKKTLIYDLDPEDTRDKSALIKNLEELFDAVVFTSGPPADVIDANGQSVSYPFDSKADILIITGENWTAKIETLTP